jgi:hypothetical protein
MTDQQTTAPTPTPVATPLTLILRMKSPEDAKAVVDLVRAVQSLPPEQNPIWVALDGLAIVHYARFVLFDDDTRLAVITTYDGTFDNYLNEFVNHLGDVFNELLKHMEGAPPLPIQSNRKEFDDYVSAHDFSCVPPFYSAYPTLTVLDIQAFSTQ